MNYNELVFEKITVLYILLFVYNNIRGAVVMDMQYMSLVSFKISSEFYAIDIMEVNEIIRHTDITPIPNAPDFVEGVITLRGEIIPIVDLGKRFHFERVSLSEDEELLKGIIIITVEGMTIGVIIDQVNRVVQINKSQIQPPPQMISGVGAEYIQGVVKMEENLLVILDIKKLFSRKELLELSGKF